MPLRIAIELSLRIVDRNLTVESLLLKQGISLTGSFLVSESLQNKVKQSLLGSRVRRLTALNILALLFLVYAVGCPDPTFNTDGKAIFSFEIDDTYYELYPKSASYDASNRLVVVSEHIGESSSDILTSRITTTGVLDTGFAGGDGWDLHGEEAKDETPVSVSVLSSGKVLVLYQSVDYENLTADEELNVTQFGFLRYGVNGGVESFGVPNQNLPYQGLFPTAMLVQSDGKILVVGYAYQGIVGAKYSYDFFVARYNSNGNTLDGSFGNGAGFVVIDYGNAGARTADLAISAALQSDGKIVILGDGCASNDTPCYRLVRLQSNGALDSTFNGTGKLALDSALNSAQVFVTKLSKVVTDSAGKIYVVGAGRAYNAGNTHEDDFLVMRLTTSGARDSGYGANGAVLVDFRSYRNLTHETIDIAEAASFDARGYLMLAGSSASVFDSEKTFFAGARITPGGRLDNLNGLKLQEVYTFPDSNNVTYSTYLDSAVALANQNTRIAVVGTKEDPQTFMPALGVVQLVLVGYDECLDDNSKVVPGTCGCGIPDTDTDGDGAICTDLCGSDPAKTAPGLCGCGVVDSAIDSDGDGAPNCIDLCPSDPGKSAPGTCGCGVADTDTDGDGVANCRDYCPQSAIKFAPGACGCGVSDVDSDLDGVEDCRDVCKFDAEKTTPEVCGCGIADSDLNDDGEYDCLESTPDLCPFDPDKETPDICGCNISDVDSDGDGAANCQDVCPFDPAKERPLVCGCGVADTDFDGDGFVDCYDDENFDFCPADPNKLRPGACGCGTPDADIDGDGYEDCRDYCAIDSGKQFPGVCGCGTVDTDSNLNGMPDCLEFGIAAKIPKKPKIKSVKGKLAVTLEETPGASYVVNVTTVNSKKKTKTSVKVYSKAKLSLKQPKSNITKMSINYQLMQAGTPTVYSQKSPSAKVKLKK